MSKSSQLLIIGILTFFGISALASGLLPFTFQAGQPIKADEVNANFEALANGKQNVITTTPCGDGQFVTGVEADGNLSCGIDQIGSAGSSGVSSLNGKTGSLAIEGGNGVTVETSEDGKVTISAGTSASGDFSPQATIAVPSSGVGNVAGAAFKITNNNTASSSIALNGVSQGGAGVFGQATNGFGVRGKTNTGYGVYGETSVGSGVEGHATSPGWYGVLGANNATGGVGVRGVGSAGTGVWGASTSG